MKKKTCYTIEGKISRHPFNGEIHYFIKEDVDMDTDIIKNIKDTLSDFSQKHIKITIETSDE